MKKCRVCGELKSEDCFYSNGFQKSGKKKYKSICSECYCGASWIRHWCKIMLIVGDPKCSRCGYDYNLSALEFHHPNRDKEHEISDSRTISYSRMRREISKCDLLCSNCHRDEHNKDKRKVATI